MDKLTIKDLLKGCEVGQIQRSGAMQVIPLLSDLEFDKIGLPSLARVSTKTYGHVVYSNPTDEDLIMPSCASYIVKESVQDHSVPQPAFVGRRSRVERENAMCIQSTQPGTIKEGNYELTILPLALKRKAIQKQHDISYSKLWGDIGNFNSKSKATSDQSLVSFERKYANDMNEFVAQFERVPNQVGAIILIGGEVVGLERCPTVDYFTDIWVPLIRMCYGGEAIHRHQMGTLKNDTPNYDIGDVKTLDDLITGVRSMMERENEKAKSIVRGFIDDPLTEDQVNQDNSFIVSTVDNNEFIGQIVRHGQKIPYVSLMTQEGWATEKPWATAKEFAL